MKKLESMQVQQATQVALLKTPQDGLLQSPTLPVRKWFHPLHAAERRPGISTQKITKLHFLIRFAALVTICLVWASLFATFSQRIATKFLTVKSGGSQGLSTPKVSPSTSARSVAPIEHVCSE